MSFSKGFIVEGFQTERKFDMHEDQTIYHVVDDDSIVNVIGRKGFAGTTDPKETKSKAAKAAKPSKEANNTNSPSTNPNNTNKTGTAVTPATPVKKDEKKVVLAIELKENEAKQDKVKEPKATGNKKAKTVD